MPKLAQKKLFSDEGAEKNKEVKIQLFQLDNYYTNYKRTNSECKSLNKSTFYIPKLFYIENYIPIYVLQVKQHTFAIQVYESFQYT